MNIHNAYKYTLILIIITLLIRLIIAWKTGLGIGEAYYFRGAKDIALSYFDQPPLFLWLSGLSIRLFCLSNFALRLPAVLLFAGTSWLLYIIGERMSDNKGCLVKSIADSLDTAVTIYNEVKFNTTEDTTEFESGMVEELEVTILGLIKSLRISAFRASDI